MSEVFEDDEMKLLEAEAEQERRAHEEKMSELDAGEQTDEGGNDETDEREGMEGEYIPDEEMIGLLTIPVSFAAGWIAPNWGIKEDEVVALSTVLDQFIDKYFPNARIPNSPEAALLVTLGMIAGPRVSQGIPMKAPDQQENGSQEQKQTQSGGKAEGGLSVLAQKEEVNGEAV